MKNFLKRLTLLSFTIVSLSAQANVVGGDTQNFNPITNGLDFVTVHSSETLEPGIINFGFFLNYAVNSLPNFENVSTASRTNFSDSLLSADFNFGLGLGRNWDMGVSFPYLVSQSVDSDVAAFRGEFAKTGLTEVRANTKYRLYGDNSHGLAAIASINLNQIENNPFTGQDSGPTYNLELAADKIINKVAIGGNIGYRFRDPGEPLPQLVGVLEPIRNQYITSLAMSYLFQQYDTKLIGELFGSFPAEDTEFISDRNLSSMELLIGIKTDISSDLAFHFGGGTEVMHGTSSPDWRVYSGLNWTMGPIFKKSKETIVRVADKDSVITSADGDADPFSKPPQAQESFVAREVLFKFNSDEVDESFKQALLRMVDYLKQPPGFETLVISGHTDSVGPEEYNDKLSLRRAEAVRKVFITAGVPEGKIKAAGMGERQPIADNGNFQGRSKNRRVEFDVQRQLKK